MHPRVATHGVRGRRLNRRDFLRAAAGALTGVPLASVLLAACSTEQRRDDRAPVLRPPRPDNPWTNDVDQARLIAAGGRPEAGPLQVFTWKGYVSPRVIGMFENRFGVSVNVTTFTTMVDALTKLTGKESQDFDVIVGLPTQFVGRFFLMDLLRPLQHADLPNLSNIWDSLSGIDAIKDEPFYDVGSHYTVPYAVWTTGIGYRIDKGPTDHIAMDLSYLKEAVPAMDNPYDLLWDPRFKGHGYMLDDYREALAFAMLGRDKNADINTADPAVINQAWKDMGQAIRTVGTKFDVNAYANLAEGRAYVHQAWSGDLLSAHYYPSWSPRKMIRYWYPSGGGGVIGSDAMAVLTKGKNPVLAHAFLNHMLDFNIAMENFTWTGYVSPQKGIADPSVLVTGSADARPYAIVPSGLANAIPQEADFLTGVRLLELIPEVDDLWKDAWEVHPTP